MAVEIDLLNSNSTTNITTNFERVAEALQDVVGRSGSLPNQMNSDLDMNSNDLLNIRTLDVDALLIDGVAVVPSDLGAFPPNSVGAAQIIDGSVGNDELANGAVESDNVTNDAQELALLHYKLTGEYSPEMYGTIGVNAAGDTAAWVALAAAANADGGVVRITCFSDEYLIAGSTINFEEIDSLYINRKKAVFRQQTAFSKNIQITDCGDVEVEGGVSYGYANIEILAAQTPSEYDGALSTYNGVADIFCLNAINAYVHHVVGRNHAGGCLVVLGSRDTTNVSDNNIKGIGYPYIDPIGDGNQGNNSDFGIMSYPTANYPVALGWNVEYIFNNNRIWDHAFCVQVVQSKTLHMHGNTFGPSPGQHNVYAIECDGINLTDNIFMDSRQQGFKMQLENYSGLYIGTQWATGVDYEVDDQVRYQGNLYDCITAHTSGGSFDAAKFEASPLTNRNGGIISNNIFLRNGEGIGFIPASPVDGRMIYVRGLEISNNKFVDCVNSSIYGFRLVDSKIVDNHSIGSIYAMYLTDFSGDFSGNTIKGSTLNGLLATIAYDTTVTNNTFIDCGLSGTDNASRSPILIAGIDSVTGLPFPDATPFAFFRNNGIIFTTGDGAGDYLMYSTDTRIDWTIESTYGTATTKLFRIDGDLIYQFRNHFPGYFNTAQNPPDYTTSNGSTTRTYDASAADLSATKNVLYTLINDLIALKVLK